MLKKKRRAFVYTCCFSNKKDDLEQWRGYGVHGSGYAIGFDRDKLKDLALVRPNDPQITFDKQPRTRQGPVPRAGYVIYDENLQQRWCELMVELMTGILHNLPNALDENAIATIVRYIEAEAGHYLPLMKNHHFKSEQEFRVYVSEEDIHRDTTWDKHEGNILNFVHFRSSGDILVPFLKIRSNPEWSSPILDMERIVVGPKLNVEKEKILESMELFLKQNNYWQTKVEFSEVPFL